MPFEGGRELCTNQADILSAVYATYPFAAYRSRRIPSRLRGCIQRFFFGHVRHHLHNLELIQMARPCVSERLCCPGAVGGLHLVP